MEIQSLKLACFSPTGNSKLVGKIIAQNIKANSTQQIDITRPRVREQTLSLTSVDLLVVVVPVYMGRVPALLENWFSKIEANNTPVICVVVYGNRVYDNALLELKDILAKRGCVPIAGAAFIGEHSFSNSQTPIAAFRPDSIDLDICKAFGSEINKMITEANSLTELPTVSLPGKYPYGGVTRLWSVDFLNVSDRCEQCGKCAEVCPMDAINPVNSRDIDIDKCISCCACIKNCPNIARTMKDSKVKDASVRLFNNCKERKEPELFFSFE
ncbi:MAG: EFR1 family ferrodoxin [bacterium]